VRSWPRRKAPIFPDIFKGKSGLLRKEMKGKPHENAAGLDANQTQAKIRLAFEAVKEYFFRA
jgi:hypothetical protein